MGRSTKKVKHLLTDAQKAQFEQGRAAVAGKDIRMISGCTDSQLSAVAPDVRPFHLPNPFGLQSGACTSALLHVLYIDNRRGDVNLSYTEVLTHMRDCLKSLKFTQIPQLTSFNPIDVNARFELVHGTAGGTRRAVMIGINYVGVEGNQLTGCHGDVINMKKYLMEVEGFKSENIAMLMDDGVHTRPTRANMINAYRKVVADSKAGDSVFLHYSGHGSSLLDDQANEEPDAADEVLCPVDMFQAGMIRDDVLHDIIVKGLAEGVHLVSVMDSCNSGTVLDLPYIFKGDGNQRAMELDDNMDLKGLLDAIDADSSVLE